jgi:hypothetical protein
MGTDLGQDDQATPHDPASTYTGDGPTEDQDGHPGGYRTDQTSQFEEQDG